VKKEEGNRHTKKKKKKKNRKVFLYTLPSREKKKNIVLGNIFWRGIKSRKKVAKEENHWKDRHFKLDLCLKKKKK